LHSNKAREEWPTGANVSILLKVKKKKFQLILAGLSGILGAVCLLMTPKIWESSIFWAIAIGVLGTMLIVTAYLLHSRKLSFTP
jgi:hypothetical protein